MTFGRPGETCFQAPSLAPGRPQLFAMWPVHKVAPWHGIAGLESSVLRNFPIATLCSMCYDVASACFSELLTPKHPRSIEACTISWSYCVLQIAMFLMAPLCARNGLVCLMTPCVRNMLQCPTSSVKLLSTALPFQNRLHFPSTGSILFS